MTILKPHARLLSIGNDPKTVKGERIGIRTAILYMKPGTLCPWKTKACFRFCLDKAGRGVMSSVQESRERKEVEFLQERQAFLARLERELRNHARTSARKGMEAYARLNGLTDVPYERIAPSLFDIPGIRFYDYTKSYDRAMRYLTGDFPASYSLTFSWSGENIDACRSILLHGGSVAVPVMPEIYDALFRQGDLGFFRAYAPLKSLFGDLATLVDGDEHDARPLNPRRDNGSLIVLRAKGPARHDTSGFVVDIIPNLSTASSTI